MQTKFSDGSIGIVGGVTKDSEYKLVGDNSKSLTKFSVALGENENGEKIYCDCECWHKVAEIARTIKKADTIFAIGKIRVNEYDNKNGEHIKKNILVIEFLQIMRENILSVIPVSQTLDANNSTTSKDFENISDDENDLPF